MLNLVYRISSGYSTDNLGMGKPCLAYAALKASLASSVLSCVTNFMRRWGTSSESQSGQNKCNETCHVKFPLEIKLPNKGSSGNPMHTGSSHRPANLMTAFPLGGCCQKCTHRRYAYKHNYDIINSMIPNKVDRRIV